MTTNELHIEPAQMQIHEAVQACNTGWDAVDAEIAKLGAYIDNLDGNLDLQRNRSFAFTLLIIMKMSTSQRWLALNHFAESHGMELYK